jgi:hypothetical protein
MNRLILAMLLVAICAGNNPTFAQNWRTPNPNQPNGYRASMAAYHYKGSYKESAQPENGYRATEARSKVGMNCFAPPSSSERSEGGGGRWGSGGGRWSGGESNRWGADGNSRFAGERWGETGSDRWGSAEGRSGTYEGSYYQNAPAMQNRNEEWNEFYKRRFEATEYGNNAQSNTQQFASGQAAPLGGNISGYSPGESFGAQQAMRMAVGASAVRRMLRNSNEGGFNRIYSSNNQ